MTIKIIDRLHKSGELRTLIASGVVSASVLEWRKIHHAYNDRVKNYKSPKKQAAIDVGKVFGVSWRRVYEINAKMNYKSKEK